jgi:hypothetical protein
MGTPDLKNSIKEAAETRLGRALEQHTYADFLHARGEIRAELEAGLRDAYQAWGLDLTGFELEDVRRMGSI